MCDQLSRSEGQHALPDAWSDRLEAVLAALEKDRQQREVSEACTRAALVRIESFQREMKNTMDSWITNARIASTTSKTVDVDASDAALSIDSGGALGSAPTRARSDATVSFDVSQSEVPKHEVRGHVVRKSTLEVLQQLEKDSVDDAESTHRSRRSNHVKKHLDTPLLSDVSFIEEHHTSSQKRIHTMVKSQRFEILCMVVVALNLVASFVQIEVKVVGSQVHRAADFAEYFEIVEVSFLTFYIVEMTMKLWIYNYNFFKGKDAYWNTFDFVLVLIGILSQVQVVLVHQPCVQWTWLRVMRPLRLVRSFRLVKIMRFFKDLRIIVDSLAQAGSSFMYACLMVLCIMFAAALILLEGVGDWLLRNEEQNSELKDQVILHWGGIHSVLLTLFEAISGGGPWGVPATVLHQTAGPFYFAVFLLYVSLVCFAVLRVLTGIFCNHAMAASNHEKDSSTIHELRRLFRSIDANATGTVTSREIQWHIRDTDFARYIGELGIQGEDVLKIFRVLDCDDDDAIGIEELVHSFNRLRGTARNVDMVLLMCEVDLMKEALRVTGRPSNVARYLGN